MSVDRNDADVRTVLKRIKLCERKAFWAWSEIGELVDSLAVSDPFLDSFLLWCVVRGYRATTMLHENGTAEVTLHRGCCPWLR